MDLNGIWLLEGKDEQGDQLSLPATVPGCVHTDLMANGKIKNLYYRDNPLKAQWIEQNDFTYTKTFTVNTLSPNAFLEFDGLDTYCTIFLNGIKLGEADNMFIPHCFLVDGILVQGENTLCVAFRSPVKEVANLPSLHGAFTTERLYTRRIQCTYGWDWTERFVTMGIYRDVRLIFRKSNEIKNFYLYNKSVNSYAAQLSLQINFKNFIRNGSFIQIEILSPQGLIAFSTQRALLENTLKLSIDIPAPELWYPNGYGNQPLYTLRLKTKSCYKEHHFGIREITLLQVEDSPGSKEESLCRQLQTHPHICRLDKNKATACFTVLVNGIKIFCKGGNWVPCEPFPSAETPEKITNLLALAQNAGVNMLRVWGGGIFEQNIFYEECDRLGILVTQDFLMACGNYPEKEQWFIDALKKEASSAALRLRTYTCLAWWSGDNENAVMGTENTCDFPGYKSAVSGIAPILEQLDPQRYFLPSSPFGGEYFCSATRGTTHNTYYLGDIFEYIRNSDFDGYLHFFDTFLSRFNTEQSAMGMSFVSSLKEMMTPEDIFGKDTSMLQYHTKSNPALLPYTLYNYTEQMSQKIFGKFRCGQDRILKMQMLQCEWIRFSLELFRRNKWFSSGIIYWMYNDCWPAASGWSIVDYYSRPKPAYYAFKRGAKPFILSLTVQEKKLCVYGCNDSLTAITGTGKLYLYNFKENKNIVEKEFHFCISKNSAKQIFACSYCELTAQMTDNTVILCDAQSNLNTDRALYIPHRYTDMNILYNEIEITEETETSITVKAREFTPFAIVDIPYLLEDNCLILKKGESKKIKKATLPLKT